ncbi:MULTISPECIES: peptidylprolyl isomerase [unclassified Pseudoalteromonas]|uniref:peptidylprolyl isomerase n=1 Tax=unclassified Pseudoalteromonas TaxID=194690 RepID=UPI0030143E2F
MKNALLLTMLGAALAGNALAQEQSNRSPSEIVAAASDADWQRLDPENILQISLATGPVYIALNPQLAPNHVKNIKALAREDFYTGLSMYRFVENFVAQGGDMEGKKAPKQGKKAITQEFVYHSESPLTITSINAIDGYAANSGFLNGFAVAQNEQGTQTWMTHCTGAFAMARGNDVDSGGTEFYVTLTPQRYLDKNTTVFGQLIAGMEHIQKLDRAPTADKPFNLIKQVSVLADLEKRPQFKRLKTDTALFAELIAARKHRVGEWFVSRPNHTDVCSVTVPVEKTPAQ